MPAVLRGYGADFDVVSQSSQRASRTDGGTTGPVPVLASDAGFSEFRRQVEESAAFPRDCGSAPSWRGTSHQTWPHVPPGRRAIGGTRS
jgi:hypothetical protein